MSNGKPRRRSIFGGLLLIIIGGLLLADNLITGFAVWTLFSRYWPLILILWGLAKLFDYFASRRAGEAAPPTFSGGEFFLLILLLLFVGGVASIRELGERVPGLFEGPWDQTYSFPLETSAKNIKPDARILVHLQRGDIRILPEDITEIRAVATRNLRVGPGSREDEVRRWADAVTLEIREVGGIYELRPRGADLTSRRLRVDLELHVPKQASVELKTDRGNIFIASLQGIIRAEVGSGDIEIRDASRSVDLKIRSGDVRVSGVKETVHLLGDAGEVEVNDVGGEAVLEGNMDGPIRLSNIAKGARYRSNRTDLSTGPLPGRVELSGGTLEVTDVNGAVSVTTREKHIRFENVAGKIFIRNRNGDVDLRFANPPKDEVDVENQSGAIELLLPASSSFDLAASSRNGEVESEFAAPTLKKSEEQDTVKLEGKIGARGPALRLTTTYGTISLRKSD